MPDTPLQLQAIERLRQQIPRNWPGAQELSSQEIIARFPIRTSLVAGWRLPAAMKQEPYELLIFLDESFPWSLPLVAVPEAPEAITVPHLESDGHFCLTPSSAKFTLPVGIEHLMSLVSAADKVLADGRANANDDDFLKEALSYWSIVQGSAAQLWLTSPAPNGHVLWSAMKHGKHWVLASSSEELKAWYAKAGYPEESVGPCLIVRLEDPLYPDKYPLTMADLLDLIHDAGAGEVLDQALRRWKAQQILPVLLVFVHAGADVCLGACFLPPSMVRANGAKKNGIPGFRAGGRIGGKFPAQALRMVADRFPHMKAIPVFREYLHTRTAGVVPTTVSKAHVVIAGCGALGGELAVQLAKAGVGEITLIDHDTFDWQNVGRHVLDSAAVGQNKAKALVTLIHKSFPDAKLTAHPTRWESLSDNERGALQGAEIFVSLTGEAAGNQQLDLLVNKGEMPTMVYGWTEPFAVAGHAVLQFPDSGRLQTITDEYGVLREPVADLTDAPDLPQEPACGAFYQPYSSLAALTTVALIGGLVLDALMGKVVTSTHRVWVGSVAALGNNGLSTTEVWRQRINNWGDNRQFDFVIPPTE